MCVCVCVRERERERWGAAIKCPSLKQMGWLPEYMETTSAKVVDTVEKKTKLATKAKPIKKNTPPPPKN